MKSTTPNSLSRRHFLSRTSLLAGSIAGAATCGRLAAVEPFGRPGKPRLRSSLAAYSFRDFFVDGRRANSRPKEPAITLFDFIDYCADHRCDGTELTGYYFPANTDAEYLLKLKRHAFLRGIEISGTAVGNKFTLPDPGELRREIEMVKTWIDRAAIMGAPHIRVFAGNQGNDPLADATRRCIGALEDCCDYAGQKGVFLGLENHGGIVAEPDGLLKILHAVNSPWLGINLDTGNFHTDDPYRDLDRCAPYAVNVQLKVEIRPRGKAQEPTDLKRIIQMLEKNTYQGYVALEYEAAHDPWTTIPRHLETMRSLLAS